MNCLEEEDFFLDNEVESKVGKIKFIRILQRNWSMQSDDEAAEDTEHIPARALQQEADISVKCYGVGAFIFVSDDDVRNFGVGGWLLCG